MKSSAAVAVVALAVVGCGDSGGGDKSKTTTPPEPSVAKPLSGVPQFKACVKKTGAKVKPEPPTTDGRIAVGAAGSLPATYVGAVVYPNGAYMDVWLADNAENGAATADKLNKAEAKSRGVPEVEAAFSNGRAVGAPGNTEAFADTLDTAKKIDGCLKATNG
jgi:hypothetical protein